VLKKVCTTQTIRRFFNQKEKVEEAIKSKDSLALLIEEKKEHVRN